jgi:hypothetical protein
VNPVRLRDSVAVIPAGNLYCVSRFVWTDMEDWFLESVSATDALRLLPRGRHMGLTPSVWVVSQPLVPKREATSPPITDTAISYDACMLAVPLIVCDWALF